MNLKYEQLTIDNAIKACNNNPTEQELKEICIKLISTSSRLLGTLEGMLNFKDQYNQTIGNS